MTRIAHSGRTGIRRPRPLIATGVMVGADTLTNLTFQPNKPYRACLLCGTVFQSDLDRRLTPNEGATPRALRAADSRDQWAARHASTHTDREHLLLKLSGRSMTPEAAQTLAPYGVVPVVDLVMDEEIEHALATALRAPTDDAEDR